MRPKSPLPQTTKGFNNSRAAAQSQKKLRIALYSHDTMGIGHLRRNLLIAQTFSRAYEQITTLLIAGAREASAFCMPAGVDCVTLPSVYKDEEGRYRARHLGISLQELTLLRSRIIHAALESFEPDVLIVDKAPRGSGGELDLTLEELSAGGRTHCILGLREVLDDPMAVERDWKTASNEEAICRFYDAIWIYGDPAVFDPVREYGFSSEIEAKVRYTGYLDQRQRMLLSNSDCPDLLRSLGLPSEKLIVCVMGGGQDGAPLAEAFVAAELPRGTDGVLISGPFMPLELRQRLYRQVAGDPRRRVLEFIANPELLLSQADRVIAMGGYNTVCEILSFEKPALIVPRIKPRQEQLIRAERLRRLGLLEVLHPDQVSPSTLAAWLAQDVQPRPPARECVDLNGLSRLPLLLNEVLARPPLSRQRPRQEKESQFVVP